MWQVLWRQDGVVKLEMEPSGLVPFFIQPVYAAYVKLWKREARMRKTYFESTDYYFCELNQAMALM